MVKHAYNCTTQQAEAGVSHDEEYATLYKTPNRREYQQ